MARIWKMLVLMAVVSAVTVLMLLAAGGSGTVLGAPPGPGDTQCVPGQNGPPHAGFKPPTSCPGNNH
jgi:hypothetical protein